jgi:hypothetical protein
MKKFVPLYLSIALLASAIFLPVAGTKANRGFGKFALQPHGKEQAESEVA